MVKKLISEPPNPTESRPGRRWGAGLASIMALLGSRHRTIEDDSTWFAELRAMGDKKDEKRSDKA